MKTGILNRATEAKQTNEEKQAEEELRLGISALTIDYRKNTTNTDSFREYVMNNKQALANAMGVNQNEITMERETYTITYKGQMYIVEADGSLSSYRLIELTGFNIKETTLSIQEGRTKKLTIENRSPNGANEGIVWTSSDPTIASVDANGVVTGVKQSATTATITATSKSGNVTSSTSCVVTVTRQVSEIEEGINPDRYGEYVNYNFDLGIDGNFDGVDDGTNDDWRVFYEDSQNIYLIAADCAPLLSNEVIHEALLKTNPRKITEEIASWNWSEIYTCKDSTVPSQSLGAADIFIKRPLGTEYLISRGFLGFWKEVLEGTRSGYDSLFTLETNHNGNAQMTAALMDTEVWKELSDTNIGTIAIGAPTLSMWVESWNAKHGDGSNDEKIVSLRYDKVGSVGYFINNSVSSIKLADTDGYTDKLYFPREPSSEGQGYCSHYYLASPGYTGNTYYDTCYVSLGGYVGTGANPYYEYTGLRPIVCIPSTHTISKESGSDVWQIVPKN